MSTQVHVWQSKIDVQETHLSSWDVKCEWLTHTECSVNFSINKIAVWFQLSFWAEFSQDYCKVFFFLTKSLIMFKKVVATAISQAQIRNVVKGLQVMPYSLRKDNNCSIFIFRCSILNWLMLWMFPVSKFKCQQAEHPRPGPHSSYMNYCVI